MPHRKTSRNCSPTPPCSPSSSSRVPPSSTGLHRWRGGASARVPGESIDFDVSDLAQSYRRKRDMVVSELQDDFEIAGGGGAFYLFVRTPWGTGTEFVTQAIKNNLLLIPGNVFSSKDTHFRISYAAEDETLERGMQVLRKLAKR